jgi:hypothetical protein
MPPAIFVVPPFTGDLQLSNSIKAACTAAKLVTGFLPEKRGRVRFVGILFSQVPTKNLQQVVREHTQKGHKIQGRQT